VVMSGGDDGALAGHCIDLSVKCVVARGRQALAHAAQITGPISGCFIAQKNKTKYVSKK